VKTINGADALDVLLEARVGFKADPPGVILIISHASAAEIAQGLPAHPLNLLLSYAQAEQLSELLLRKRHEAKSARRRLSRRRSQLQ
jgi:hypothetical protein